MNVLVKVASVFMFVCLVFTACKHKRDYKAEAEKFHKKRPDSPLIKSLKTYLTLDDSAHQKPVEILQQDEEYNASGQKIKETHYNDSGVNDYTTTYMYDEKGNVAKKHTIYATLKYELIEENTYDKDNHLLKTEWSQSDGNSGRHEYMYDKTGQMCRWDSYEKGVFVITRLYPFFYDENGRPVESFYRETTNGHDTTTNGHDKYTYDSTTGLESGKFIFMGNIPMEIVQSQYDKSRNKILEFHYIHDSAGNVIPKTRIMNIFNEYGEITENNVYDEARLLTSTSNTYDKYGHIVESVTTEGKAARKLRYVYTFQ